MASRRSLLKGIAAGTGTLSYSGYATATEGRAATTDILADNREYRDIYASDGKESIEVRFYKTSKELVFISTPNEPNKLKGRDVTSEDIPLPDPPELVKSWSTRKEKVSSNCSTTTVSNHYFVGIDLKLTSTGTTASSTLLASVVCALPSGFVGGVLCALGALGFNLFILQGYGIKGEGTVGFLDVDKYERVYTEKNGWVEVGDSPAVAVVGYPEAGASTDKLQFVEVVTSFFDLPMPEVSPVHMEPYIEKYF